MREDFRPMLFNDHFQNYKRYNIPKAQLIIADIPYNIGKDAYGSNPSWYIGGDNANGASEKAGKEFFDTDKDFRITEFLHFCSNMLVKEPKETGKAPCMIVFCAFEQQFELIEKAKKYGLNGYINLVFRKNFSAQVLKANMRIVGNCEYAILLYREKLPKFNNNGKMIFNCFEWTRDNDTPKIPPTQKTVNLYKWLLQQYAKQGDKIFDSHMGSQSSRIAAYDMGFDYWGCELDPDYFAAGSNRFQLFKHQQKLFL